ncbi:MAG: hypothetical protein EU542_06985, partial [Promethearchaeota archaeon]
MDTAEAKQIVLSDTLPPAPKFRDNIRRAPNRGFNLDRSDTLLALKNALRYVPEKLHDKLAPEFLEE